MQRSGRRLNQHPLVMPGLRPTVCSRRGGRPEHKFITVTTPREHPLFFQTASQDSLPMGVNMSDIGPGMSAQLRADLSESMNGSSWLPRPRLSHHWDALPFVEAGFLFPHLAPRRQQWLLFANQVPPNGSAATS